MLNKALEKGFYCFDTADFYGNGHSEKVIAKAIKGCRDDVFISTKAGLVWEGNSVTHNGRAEYIKEACYRSLERLGTDYIDVFSLHWPDQTVPIEESIRGLQELKIEGVILDWGLCNVDQAPKDVWIQSKYNLLHRPSLIGSRNAVYSPFEQGLLLGAKPRSKKDIRWRNPFFKSQKHIDWANRFLELCGEHSPVHVNLAWLLAQPKVNAIICGLRNTQQLEELGVIAPDIFSKELITHIAHY